MPSLLDTPTDDEQALLSTVARCFYDAQDKWPVWQYVERKFYETRPDLDGLEVLLGMPSWQHGYRHIRVDLRGNAGPERGATVQLTVAGMHHSGCQRLADLVGAFLVAVNEAAKKQRSVEPEPLRAVDIPLTGPELTQIVHEVSGVAVPTLILSSMLAGEPATWHGLETHGGVDWLWRLEDVRLTQFREVRTVEKYLVELEKIVANPIAAASAVPLPPMALPDALDHLDLAWRVAFKTPLMQIKRAALPAVLTQDVHGAEELENRCSALATVFDGFTTRVRTADAPHGNALGTLAGMQAKLRAALGAEADRAVDAVRVLRDVQSIRTGQQHRERDVEAERAKVRLGLVGFGSNWAGVWERLRHALVDALRTIREELPD